MGFGMFIFTAALSCAPVDVLPVPNVAAPFTVDDLDTLSIPAGAEESCMAVHRHDTMPLPKMFDPDFHAQQHQSASSRNGAQQRTLPCNEQTEAYSEKDYYSSAAHTTLVGWRFRACDGTIHWYGSFTSYCDSYVQCCAPPYEDEISTCEGS